MRAGVKSLGAVISLAIVGWVGGGSVTAPMEARAAGGETAADDAVESEPLVVEATIAGPIDELWRVFSTAEGFKNLGVAKCELDLRVGGLIRTHYNPNGVIGDEGTIVNEILAYEPARMMAFRLKQPPKGFPFAKETWSNTWSVATFSDLGDGRTHLRLAGMGYPETEDGRKMREFFQAGNSWVMQKLAAQFDATLPAPKHAPHPARSLAAIHDECVVALPRSEVWELYATSAGWKRFLGVDSRIELTPGGKFEILFGANEPAGQQGSEGCTVLSFVPAEMLSYTWNAPTKFAHARARNTWVVVRFDDLAATRTRVRIDHYGFQEQAAANPDHKAEWEDVRAYFVGAWGRVLAGLKAQAKPEPGPATR